MIENSISPAFPDEKNYGLTKREYFAGLALQAILSNPDGRLMDKSHEYHAGYALRMADELLKQLGDVNKPL